MLYECKIASDTPMKVWNPGLRLFTLLCLLDALPCGIVSLTWSQQNYLLFFKFADDTTQGNKTEG